MRTVEALVDTNGMVKILSDVRLPRNRRALLIILDEKPEESRQTKKIKLIAAFKKAHEASVFKDIEDPVAWQRKLRDEW